MPDSDYQANNGTIVFAADETSKQITILVNADTTFESDENFTVHLRVPAWADAKTRISVNGKRAEGDATPGKFFAVTRTWKNGDRLEFEMGMPWRLEAVDAQNPDWVALLHGPLSLFGTAELPARVTRAQLLAARPSPADSDDFVVTADAGKLTFRPFARIADEPYHLYQRIGG